jgi:hypothetical protein
MSEAIAVIGHNQPPSAIESAKEAHAELAAYLQDNPVITSPEAAKEAAGWIERTRVSLQAARAARDAETSPLNTALKKIRDFYDLVREKTSSNRGGALQVAYDELKRRVTAYADAVEAARIAEAEALRAQAEAAKARAMEADLFERELIANADAGECADVTGATVEANAAFKEFQKADRSAAVAERGVTVRLSSVMGAKALSMRTTRKLVIADPQKAFAALWPNEKVRAALIAAARDFEDAYAVLPEGIGETFERSL